MIKSGFHNSINGDRLYNAEDMNRPYKDIVSNGVFPNPSTQLQVLASSGMTVSVSVGGGLFGSGWVYNDAPVLLTLDNAEQTLNRYDAIVLKRDESEDVRNSLLYIKKGTPASEPAVPTMTRDNYVSEYCLALIYIPAKSTQVTQSQITDTRPDTNVCGWVTGLIEQVDTSTLFLQWQTAYAEQFDNWQATNQSQLDEWNVKNQTQYDSWDTQYRQLLDDMNTAFTNWWDVARTILATDESAAAEILRLRQEKADKVRSTVTLNEANWVLTGEYYYQTIAVDGIGANDILLVGADKSNIDAYSNAGVMCTDQADGSVTFRASVASTVIANIVNMGE